MFIVFQEIMSPTFLEDNLFFGLVNSSLFELVQHSVDGRMADIGGGGWACFCARPVANALGRVLGLWA